MQAAEYSDAPRTVNLHRFEGRPRPPKRQVLAVRYGSRTISK
jgi:hypothetical protein